MWVNFHPAPDLATRHGNHIPQGLPGGLEAHGAMLSQSAGAAVTTDMYSSQFWRLETQAQDVLVPGESP